MVGRWMAKGSFVNLIDWPYVIMWQKLSELNLRKCNKKPWNVYGLSSMISTCYNLLKGIIQNLGNVYLQGHACQHYLCIDKI